VAGKALASPVLRDEMDNDCVLPRLPEHSTNRLFKLALRNQAAGIQRTCLASSVVAGAFKAN
jgi:hypothetical protein